MLDHIHQRKSGRQSTGSMEGWGRTYDTLTGFMFLGQERRFRQASLAQVKIQPQDCILEVGCGTGSLTLAAKMNAGPDSSVYGIDIASDMIEKARQKAAKARLDVKFEVGRIESIPFPDNTFDLVLSSLMLHHVHGDEAKQKGIQEISRVLKPGGRILIVDIEPPQNSHFKGLYSLLFGHEMMAQNVRDIVPLLEESGFENIETGPTENKLMSYISASRP